MNCVDIVQEDNTNMTKYSHFTIEERTWLAKWQVMRENMQCLEDYYVNVGKAVEKKVKVKLQQQMIIYFRRQNAIDLFNALVNWRANRTELGGKDLDCTLFHQYENLLTTIHPSR